MPAAGRRRARSLSPTIVKSLIIAVNITSPASAASSSPMPPLTSADDDSSSEAVDSEPLTELESSLSSTVDDGDVTDLVSGDDIDTGSITKPSVTDVRVTGRAGTDVLTDSGSKFAQLEEMLTRSAKYSEFLAGRMPSRYQNQHTMKLFESSADRQNQSAKLTDRDTATVSDARLEALRRVCHHPTKELFMYQAVGVDWLLSLYENGLNGILADEMGLGKTVQVIVFIAHLLTRGVRGPFIVIAPLSTLDSWVTEFQAWCPQVPVMKYYGLPDERRALREKLFNTVNRTSKTKSNNAQKSDAANEPISVILTSYDIAYNDQKHLKKLQLKLMIVDEGHRLKNVESKLLARLKEYHSENRLLLTGTPLQNNLRELWSLMNFLLPSIFDSLSQFERWFHFDSEIDSSNTHQAILEAEKNNRLVSKLHSILHPFVLRRLKIDVLKLSMPAKREWLVYCPLTLRQRQYYEEIMTQKLRSLCSGEGGLNMKNVFVQLQKVCDSAFMVKSPPWVDSDSYSQSIVGDHSDDFIDDNDEVNNDNDDRGVVGSRRRRSQCTSKPQSKKLKRTIIPAQQMTKREILSELLLSSSKMRVVDSVLRHLQPTSGKCLIFSQYIFVLDLLEDLIESGEYGSWIRIDGSTPPADRSRQVKEFAATDAQSPTIALLSTRAAGLGLNLQSASTVILFDSDWNPQQDLQAQDRAHRVGSTADVSVLRLLTPATIEMQRYRRAEAKKVLTNVVMARNRFQGIEETEAQKAVKSGKSHEEEFLHELQRLFEKENENLGKGKKGEVVHVAEQPITNKQTRGGRSRKSPTLADNNDTLVGVSDAELARLLTGKLNSANVADHALIELADEWA